MSRLLAISTLAACEPAARVAPIVDPIVFAFQNAGASNAVVVSIRNTGDDVVFLPRCGDYLSSEIERRSGDVWVNAASAACPASLRADPIRLDVGSLYQDTVSVIQSGTYRLRLAVWRRSTTAPSESVVSQGFAIE